MAAVARNLRSAGSCPARPACQATKRLACAQALRPASCSSPVLFLWPSPDTVHSPFCLALFQSLRSRHQSGRTASPHFERPAAANQRPAAVQLCDVLLHCDLHSLRVRSHYRRQHGSGYVRCRPVHRGASNHAGHSCLRRRSASTASRSGGAASGGPHCCGPIKRSGV